ncbi:MAG: hypothetical protein PHV36_11840 [Elusimicrobiales bacterium]|nr:hypothetical protein [Elusimicrobiales bacterium]
MKNGKMIIAVFAVLVSAAISARAGEVVDFDGKSAKAVNFAEALGSVEAVKADAIKFEKVNMEIPGRPAPEFTEQQVKEMDRSIGTAIAYVREQKLHSAFAGSFACLLQRGTPEQKAEFVYQTKGPEYSFPSVCINQNKGICTWVTQKVCDMVMDPKTNVSKLVCTVAKVFVCGEVEVEADPPTSGH